VARISPIFVVGEAIFLIPSIISPKHPFAWALIVVFGVGVFMSFVALLPGTTYLRLTPEGYEQRAHFQTLKQSWQHIERFQVYRYRAILNRRVGIIYDPSYKSHSPAGRLNPHLAGVDVTLHDNYGLAADELANLMNEWLNRYKHQ
jgi:hypothetical protein